MSDQLITVIIPVYNREKYVNRCVDSVLAQKDVTTEIILVDDGSTDKSPEICDSYAAKHDNIIVIHTGNHGVSHARNHGLDIAKGRYIFFLDSDDSIVDDALSSLKAALESHNADYAVGNIAFYDPEDHYIDKCFLAEEYRDKIIDENTLWHSTFRNSYPIYEVPWGKLYKREIWETLRFKENLTSEDTYALLSILKQKPVIYSLEKTIVRQTFSQDSITRSSRSINLIDSPYVNVFVIEHLLEKEIYDTALVRFGQGTRKLIEASTVFDDLPSKERIKEIYQSYCDLSKRLSPHVSLKNKCRFILFRSNFEIYKKAQKAFSSVPHIS